MRNQNLEKKTFDLLMLKYQKRIIRLVERILQDDNEALDLTQEIFLKAYQAFPYFQGDCAFYTWLYRIAVNTTRTHLAVLQRRPINLNLYEPGANAALYEEQVNPENSLQGDELGRNLLAAIDALPEELKSVLALRELDGLSYEQIAKAMHCPLGTVRSRIFRAREAIEHKINDGS